MSGPVPVPGRVKGIERVMAGRFLGRRAGWGAGVVGANADAEQAAGDLFGTGARGAGEVLGAVVAADRGDENGEDDDCRGGKENGDGGKVIANVIASCTCQARFFRNWVHAAGIALGV